MPGRFEVMLDCQLPGLARAQRLLEDVRCIGAPAFSHLARAGFIAVGLLHSLIREKLIDQDDYDDFMKSVETVSTRIQHDAWKTKQGEQTLDAFVARYGHLRPGTYDITSSRYASDVDLYLGPIVEAATAPPGHIAKYWNDEIRARITERLEQEKLGVDCARFEAFLRDAIEGREYGKFVFTRNLSIALEDIATFGEDLGLSRDDLSYLTIEDLFMLSEQPARAGAESVRTMVDAGRAAFEHTQVCCLPGQLYSGDDFRYFEHLTSEPNFITQKAARADIAVLTSASEPELLDSIDGKIVVLPNADPGYDWIFSRRIAGLITMYGGLNSHMSIRAAEFGLPAAIGTGESLYELIANARAVELDCAARKIEIVH
jgi:phosphohistidine swiveling domain-containing protein